MAATYDNKLVALGYKGHTYFARNVRYWLRSKADLFVYESSDNTDDLEPNEMVGIWDRDKDGWL